MANVDSKNPSVHAAIQLFENLTECERLTVLEKFFVLEHDNQQQVVVYTGIFQ